MIAYLTNREAKVKDNNYLSIGELAKRGLRD